MRFLPSTIGSKQLTDLTATTVNTKHGQDVNIIGGMGGLLEGLSYNYISASYPDSVTEIYTYKTGGSGGTTVATVTVVYTTSAKNILSSVERS